VTRSRLAALCLALLAVTAGCSGPLFGSDGAGRDPYGVPETTTAETTTARPTTTTPTTTTRTTPPASLSFLTAVENHSAALRAAGQFVVRYTVRRGVGDPDGSPGIVQDQRIAADVAADRYWVVVPPGLANGTYDAGLVYQNGTAIYERDELPNGTVVYRRVPEDRERSPTVRGLALDWVYNPPNASVRFPFERNGTATFVGEEMARFTADAPADFGCVVAGSSPGGLRNVTTFRATALVDDRGILRRFECVLAGYRHTDHHAVERVTWSITGVGTATVRPPDRLVNGTAPVPPEGSDDGESGVP